MTLQNLAYYVCLD